MFVKVNAETFGQVASRRGVTGYPTFDLLVGGKAVDRVVGANRAKLEELIEKHYVQEPSPKGAGVSLNLKAFGISEAYMDITNAAIDKAQVNCLNQNDDDGHVVSNIFSGEGYLESDCDEQLLIHIPLRAECKIHSIKIVSSQSPASAPKTIQIFVNNPHLDFGSAEETHPVQTFKLKPSDLSPDSPPLTLDFVLYQKVTCLSIFVKSNQGDDDRTIINRFYLVGVPSPSLDMSSFKNVSSCCGK